jgi:glycosyltransferase involved in cell wall biosynthesis
VFTKLLIAIPALNEEQSIRSIITRSLDARQYIIDNSPVSDVSITVVSDGSTDQTVPRAQEFTDRIHLIVFPQNRGYGAAIMEAWKQSDADVLAFLDADGTCDPKFFVPLCQTLSDQDADIVLGCRLNTESRMPLLRRVGNRIFAWLLTHLSSQTVRDTASGMRVVRRRALHHLYPLPEGLHFTPAMSARAMLNRELRIVEIDMPYSEREGRSKLRVVRDGFRFLRTILEGVCLYRPTRVMGALGLGFLLFACAIMLSPLVYYLQTRTVAEWMIYRFLVSHLCATASILLFCASYIAARMAFLTLESAVRSPHRHFMRPLLRGPLFVFLIVGLMAVGFALVFGSLLELFQTGHTYEHWSRYSAATFCFEIALILLTTRGTEFLLDLLAARIDYLRENDEGRVI